MSSSVNHSSYGMKVAYKLHLQEATFAIAGHHAGLPDFGNRIDTENSSTLVGRMKRPNPDASHWKDEITLPEVKPLPSLGSHFSDMMRIRMHESALVDADRLDAEFFVNGKVERDESPFLEQLLQDLGPDRLSSSIMPPPQELREISKALAGQLREHQSIRIKALAEIMERRAESFLSAKASTSLNEKRNAILRDCLTHGADPEWKPGLYTLTAPTGGGKTDSSLTFALEHAKTHHMDRVIYVVPYTSIIDQTVKEFETLLGPDAVLPHYADAAFQLKEENELTANDLHRSFAAENWNMPVIVTTAVQFFESLFANKASKLRKIHNIANSVVIFDEAQTLPLPLLKPCVQAIAELVTNYHVTAVLCTATQPALQDLFAQALRRPTLAIPEIAPLSEKERLEFRRNRIVDDGHKDMDEMAAAVEGHNQVLCVVNTRKEAQYISGAVRKHGFEDGTFCLTTLQCAYDRERLLKQIRERLAQGESCRVVSTSLIEAGVDVDFPEAYREQTGLDSILQTAGRCNREGRREADASLVHVFSTDEGQVSFLKQNMLAFELVREDNADLASSKAIHEYFTRLFGMRGDESLDQRQILKAHERGISGCRMPFAQIAERFKLIDTPTVPVYIPVNEDASALCAQLTDPRCYTRGLFRRLGRYAVNVWPRQLDRLKEAGKISALAEHGAKSDDDAFILLDMGMYDSATGLQVDEDQLPQNGLQY